MAVILGSYVHNTEMDERVVRWNDWCVGCIGILAEVLHRLINRTVLFL